MWVEVKVSTRLGGWTHGRGSGSGAVAALSPLAPELTATLILTNALCPYPLPRRLPTARPPPHARPCTVSASPLLSPLLSSLRPLTVSGHDPDSGLRCPARRRAPRANSARAPCHSRGDLPGTNLPCSRSSSSNSSSSRSRSSSSSSGSSNSSSSGSRSRSSRSSIAEL